MSHSPTAPEAARFLRTLRVATATALASYDAAHAAAPRRATQFLALAAKGRGAWSFPSEGLLSADGLLRAQLRADGTLVLQALGAAGLTRYAARALVLKLASGRRVAVAFDADGALRLPLAANELDESDLAGFDIEAADDAS